jgi:glycosyltransferase involved in cell wall biosynthesis
MEKIKVLFITQCTDGGVYVYLRNFLELWKEVNIEVFVACPPRGPLYEYLINNDIGHYGIEMKREINLFSDLKAAFQIHQLLKEVHFDIIHLHSSKAGFVGRIVGAVNKKKCIYTPHGWAFNIPGWKRNLYIVLEKSVAFMTHKIVAISKFEMDVAIKNNVCKKGKIVLIYNGIPMFKEIPSNLIRQKYLIAQGKTIIAMAARITGAKSPRTFIDAAYYIFQKNSNVFFLLIGDGEDRLEIENLISLYKMDDVIKVTGWVENVHDYIYGIDIGVLTSNWEGFGLALLDYMIERKPIVASNVGGIPEIVVNNENGFLFRKGDYIELAEKLLILIEDKKRARLMGQKGFQILKKKFNMDRLIKEHIKLYRSILKNEADL